MARDPAATEDDPALQDVLAALDDPDCRAILTEASEPMTAAELTDQCDIPKSTVYRKLDRLSQASLVREHVEANPEGGRTTRYERDVTDVTISVEDDAEFSVAFERPPRRVDERLADIWSTMGDQL